MIYDIIHPYTIIMFTSLSSSWYSDADDKPGHIHDNG